MTVPDRPAARPAGLPPRLRLVVLGGPLALVAVLGVVYAAGGFGKAMPVACKEGATTVARLDPLVHGEVAALVLSKADKLAPDLVFKGPDGATVSLASFKGKTVLLNLWATWCVPCRQEMPALDRLQAKLGGGDFEVVPINTDTARLERPKAFLKEAGVTALPLYTDATGDAFQVLRADGQVLGLPTTMLIDRNGCELGTMAGPAAWDSPDAERLIEAARANPAPPT